MQIKLQQLAADGGHASINELVDAYENKSTVPGICTNRFCTYTVSVEEYEEFGWCERCMTPSVASLKILHERL